MCDKPTIETQKVEVEKFVIKTDANFASIDDVINVLNVLTSSERDLNYFDKPEVTNYLKASGLIEEPQESMFKVKDMEKCKNLNNYLSGFMENMISSFIEKKEEEKKD